MITLQSSKNPILKQSETDFIVSSSENYIDGPTPVAHYKMNDDSSNTTVVDSIGNNNATAQRDTNLMSEIGKIDNSLRFNGIVGGELKSHWKLDGDVTDSKGSKDGTLNIPTILNDCDSPTGFSVSDVGANVLFSTNNTTYQETAAVNIYRTITQSVRSDLGFDISFTEQDVTGKFLNVYVYVKNQTVLDKLTGVTIYIHGRLNLLGGSGGWNVYRDGESLPNFQLGWNLFTLDADNPDDTESDGADLTTADKIRFRIKHSPISEVFAEGDVVIDYLNYGTPMKTKNKQGEDNMAYHFDKKSRPITVSAGNLNYTQMSVSMWYNPDSTPSGGQYRYLFRNQGGTWDAGIKFFLIHETSGVLSWSIVPEGAVDSNDYYRLFDGFVLVPGTWYHIVCTYNKTNGVSQIYIDGALAAEIINTVADIISLNIPLLIGGDGNTSQNVEGDIDEVRFYSRPLDLEEVKTLYNDGIPIEDEEDYIDMENIDVPVNNHSLSFWYRTTDPKFQMLFQKDLGSTNGNMEFEPNDNTLKVESYTNNLWEKSFSTGIDIDDGEWHNYIYVFDSDATRFYTDGVLTDTESANPDTANNGNFRYQYIGGQGNNTYTYGMTPNGDFDDVRIYDTAISDAVVASINNQGRGTEEDTVTVLDGITYQTPERIILECQSCLPLIIREVL